MNVPLNIIHFSVSPVYPWGLHYILPTHIRLLLRAITWTVLCIPVEFSQKNKNFSHIFSSVRGERRPRGLCCVLSWCPALPTVIRSNVVLECFQNGVAILPGRIWLSLSAAALHSTLNCKQEEDNQMFFQKLFKNVPSLLSFSMLRFYNKW